MKMLRNIFVAVALICLPQVHYGSQDNVHSELAREDWGPIPTIVGEHEPSLFQDFITLFDQFMELGELQEHEIEYCWEEDLCERLENFWIWYDDVR